MADNQGQTMPAPVNLPPAPPQNEVQQVSPMWAPAQPNQQVLTNAQPAYGGANQPPMAFEVPQEQLGHNQPQPVVGGVRSGGLTEKLKTPVAAAVIGGVLLLGVGFATGYVVGHDRGAASSSTTTDGQTGFGGGMGGFGGQMPGGQGQTQQGQTQQGQTQQGQGGTGTGTSPFGQDQSQQFGPGAQDQSGQSQSGQSSQGGTTTQDGTDLSQTQ